MARRASLQVLASRGLGTHPESLGSQRWQRLHHQGHVVGDRQSGYLLFEAPQSLTLLSRWLFDLLLRHVRLRSHPLT